MNLPNSLSMLRIVLTGVFTILIHINSSWTTIAAFYCFVIASLTDWLDGYLARKLNLITNFGKLIDTLADKTLMIAAYVSFCSLGLCPAWVCIIILFREFYVTSLRMLLVEINIVMAADKFGKWKMVTQVLYCIITLLHLAYSPFPNHELVLSSFLYLSLTLTVLSGINYSCQVFKLVRSS